MSRVLTCISTPEKLASIARSKFSRELPAMHRRAATLSPTNLGASPIAVVATDAVPDAERIRPPSKHRRISHRHRLIGKNCRLCWPGPHRHLHPRAEDRERCIRSIQSSHRGELATDVPLRSFLGSNRCRSRAPLVRRALQQREPPLRFRKRCPIRAPPTKFRRHRQAKEPTDRG